MSALNNSLLLGQEGGGGYAISRSLRFNSSDSAYLSRTPSTAGNRKTWTWAGWVKRSALSSSQTIFAAVQDSNNGTVLNFTAADQIQLFNYVGGAYAGRRTTTAVYRDPSAWYHIVFVWDSANGTTANRIRLYVNGTEVTDFTTTGDPSSSDSIVNSTNAHYIGADVGFNNQYSNQYLADIYFINGQALTPTSFGEFDADTGVWNPIAYSGSYGTNGFHLPFSDNSTAAALGTDSSGNGNNWTPNNISVNSSSVVYSNYITVENCSIDTGYGPVTNGFDGNGSTLFRTTNATNSTIVFSPVPSISITSSLQFRGFIGGNQGWSVKIGSTTLASGSNDPSGNVNWTVPGAAGYTLSTSTPLRLISNGAGEGVYWNSLTVDGAELINNAGAGNDSLVDVPTNGSEVDTGSGGQVRGNYCTLNPVIPASIRNTSSSITNGNLDYSLINNQPDDPYDYGTIGVASGKWFYEVTLNTVGDGTSHNFGWSGDISRTWTNKCHYRFKAGDVYKNGSQSTTGLATSGAGDVVGVALDADAGTVSFYKNGSLLVTETSFTKSIYYPHIYGEAGSSRFYTASLNFGQRPFAYPLSGFKALCTANLPAPVITKANQVFDTVLWTGNNTSQTISLPGAFSPDLVWTKMRNAANNHWLFDTIRGVEQGLSSSSTTAESARSSSVTAFGSTGFTLGSSADVNSSAYTYAAWCWDAGSSTVTNTDGSITSSVRANPSAGFSVVTWTGTGSPATVGHGLGVTPSLIISKSRNNVSNWAVQHVALGGTKVVWLNLTNAEFENSSYWNNTNPTSSVFTVGNTDEVNTNTWTYVAYCFAPVAGYSSFGSYTGNGSADGPFVFCNFRPRWIMVKSSSYSNNTVAYSWCVLDTQRNTSNVMTSLLLPNASDSEYTVSAIDALSNGFKLRDANSSRNESGVTYVYAAFAESPFQYARAR